MVFWSSRYPTYRLLYEPLARDGGKTVLVKVVSRRYFRRLLHFDGAYFVRPPDLILGEKQLFCARIIYYDGDDDDLVLYW